MKKIGLFLVFGIDFVLRSFVRMVTILRIRPFVTMILRVLTRVVLFTLHKLYFRLEIIDHSNIPKTGGVLLAVNHQSYLDPTLVGICVWRWVTFISKIENFKVPILGPLIELGGAFPVVRGGDDDALEFFGKLLKEGHVLSIFPEGTIPAEEEIPRSAMEPKTGLLKGKTGAIRLALKARVPIVPVGLSGTGKALCPEAVPRGEKLPLPKPVKITVKFGKPWDLSSYYDQPITKELLRTLTDELMSKISGLVDHAHSYIPFTVPVSEETYRIIREYESKKVKA
ncbi:MAG: 1-acyl-sn-glycerol-3-phosphate acyltransferase [Deltaproteobacteria bacterium]|nr:1-acyl-sn-glycerol-3-phosphate acyltransferase [Deltaproteobacteria bacterium]MBI3016730.1 1-acyl-sn-glycerol-3-phosphate acyltransferase [Deltaproteobacteria bacterium]